MIVIDASACVDLALPGPTSRGEAVAQAVRGQAMTAPDLLDLEVVSALARLERAGDLTAGEAEDAVSEFLGLPVRRRSTTPLTPAAWSLRQSVRVSDAYYLALARQLRAPLITADGRLARGAPPDVAVHLAR